MLAKTKLKDHQFWSKNHDTKIREIEYPHIFLKKFNFSKNS